MKNIPGSNRALLLLILLTTALLTGCSGVDSPAEAEQPSPVIKSGQGEGLITLPAPAVEDGSLLSLLYYRVSKRDFSGEALDLDQVGRLLWAAGGLGVDGTTGPSRTYPSAGATYPLEIYLVAERIKGLDPGIYRYDCFNHSLIAVAEGEKLDSLAKAALNQDFIAGAPAAIALVAFYERTTDYYGERGERYVHMDAGYASQNIYLAAADMGLDTVAIGAFYDGEVAGLLSTGGVPLLIMPVGKP